MPQSRRGGLAELDDTAVIALADGRRVLGYRFGRYRRRERTYRPGWPSRAGADSFPVRSPTRDVVRDVPGVVDGGWVLRGRSDVGDLIGRTALFQHARRCPGVPVDPVGSGPGARPWTSRYVERCGWTGAC